MASDKEREGFIEPPVLARLQLDRARSLIDEILPGNSFYRRKLTDAGISASMIRTHEDWAHVPFTTKAELVADQSASPPYGTGLSYPLACYSRMHQTSGTGGRPLRWLDTRESWDWILRCWASMFRIVEVRSDDRLFFAFSFGPFLGFWSAFEAGTRQRLLCFPGGGMSSTARLRFLLENAVTVVLCTPTYALHLAETAEQEGIDLATSTARMLIVAGEPGGSIPATRGRLEAAWGARVIDHCGMTEMGALGIECLENPGGMHLLETGCWPEIIDPETMAPVGPGAIGELVLTNFGRLGSPLIRYRTGDLVRATAAPCPCGRSFLRLEGGILGRTDDMIHVRGNNLYPSALEAVIRRFPEIAEYRVEVDQSGSLAELRIMVEPKEGAADDLADRLSRAIRDELLFRADVKAVGAGTLPRFEMKARRITILGSKPSV